MILLPWMAAQNAQESQIKTFKSPVFLYGLLGIFRTSGVENTAWFEKRGYAALIKIN